jgi:L-lactate dehydrogenase complex protein LldG
MTGAREEVLDRIRSALGPSPAVPDIPRAYRLSGAIGGDVVALFCERAADYLATVRRVTQAELPAALAEACAERGSTRVVAAPAWSAADPAPAVTPATASEAAPATAAARIPTLSTITDSPDIAAAELDGYDAALTGCALAVAETGSIVLDGGPESGRRALTLVPDHHLCVVRADQIVASVPDAIAALQPQAEQGSPITFVSGPSATSDIELERVEGVHGPRKLDVFVVVG